MKRNRARHMSDRVPNGNERGLSLVELMVALVISLILLAGVIQIFISNKGTYTVDEELARLQENGRLSFNVLGREVRQAGLTGCTPNVNSFLAAPGSPIFPPAPAITGYEYDGTGPGDTFDIAASGFPAADGNPASWTGTEGGNLPPQLQGRGAVPGSDVIVVQRANPTNLELTGPVGRNNSTLSLTTASDIQQGRIAMISDCQTAEFFQNTSGESDQDLDRAAGGSPGNVPAATRWSNGDGWDAAASIYTINIQAFFVGQDTNGRPALRLADFSQGAPPQVSTLISGVESMQIVYGVDTGLPRGSAESYMTAAQMNANGVEPRRIVSVRVDLLTRSSDLIPGQEDTDTYQLGATDTNVAASSVTIDPPDERRLRRIFGTTIAVRNRTLRQ